MGGGGGGEENSNSKTLFYKDCSLERDRQTDRQRSSSQAIQHQSNIHASENQLSCKLSRHAWPFQHRDGHSTGLFFFFFLPAAGTAKQLQVSPRGWLTSAELNSVAAHPSLTGSSSPQPQNSSCHRTRGRGCSAGHCSCCGHLRV